MNVPDDLPGRDETFTIRGWQPKHGWLGWWVIVTVLLVIGAISWVVQAVSGGDDPEPTAADRQACELLADRAGPLAMTRAAGADDSDLRAAGQAWRRARDRDDRSEIAERARDAQARCRELVG